MNELAALTRRVEVLEAEAEIRRIQARYMFLCDTPCPEYGVASDADRIDRILELYSDDAVWEGVGDYYDNQFGHAEGKEEIRSHFERFWSDRKKSDLVLNVHYLTSEQIHVGEGEAEGQWVHMQPWLFADGTGVLRSSRLNNSFRRSGSKWLITRTRTENVFIAPLPDGFVSHRAVRSVLMQPPER